MDSLAHQQFMRAVALHRQGKALEAKPIYESIIKAYPNHADALNLLGMVASQQGHAAEAIKLINRSIEINPNEVGYRINLANVLRSVNQLDAALDSVNHVIRINPSISEAHNNRGVILKSLGRLAEALSSYDQAIRLMPNSADYMINRIRTLQSLRQINQAGIEVDDLIRKQPGCFQAYLLQGQLLQAMNQHANAIHSFDAALKIKPNYAEALNARGVSLESLHQLDAALVCYEQAIHIDPNYAGVYINRGNILQKQQRFHESVKSYEAAYHLSPSIEYLHGILLHNRMRLCDWQGFSGSTKRIENIKEGEKLIMCLPALAAVDSLQAHRRVAEAWVSDQHPPEASLGAIQKESRGQKIRVGYFSADFREHPVSQLLAGVIESHNKNDFELYAFSAGPDTKDSLKKRMELAFDHFIDISHQSNQAVAALCRSLGIDIAIDLGGHTRDSRIGIFAHRAAPIQVSYLGYPGTTGAQYMDYLMADEVIIPSASKHYYAEKIVYLPSYQPNDVTREVTMLPKTRADYGLPEKGAVFCCFNESYKIVPQVFDSWMKILRSVEGSVLWLRSSHFSADNNLKKEAAARGVDPSRLLFANRVPTTAEHLARYRLADLFLDTFPYNAHTTASDALWAGLPVLTRIGESFASRVAASVLNSIGLPELITESVASYEALAIELGSNLDKLDAVKEKHQRNRLRTPLFDTRSYTLTLEAAYQAMYDRYQAGLAPDHLVIGAHHE